MISYALRRIMLMVPTLLSIMVVNFFIVQAAPGGPIEQMIARLKGSQISATERVSGGAAGEIKGQSGGDDSRYRGARGLDPAFIKELEKQYGFDKPPLERFLLMMKSYLTFDLGNSFFRDRRVVDLIRDKLPVSISIGLWAMLTKNCFLDEVNKQYVLTARAKGLSERRVLYGHVFRNAMLLVVASFPATFIGILFTGSLLIEVIFSLDGLGLLGFEAAINRDYPIMFGALYVFTLIGLVL